VFSSSSRSLQSLEIETEVIMRLKVFVLHILNESTRYGIKMDRCRSVSSRVYLCIKFFEMAKDICHHYLPIACSSNTILVYVIPANSEYTLLENINSNRGESVSKKIGLSLGSSFRRKDENSKVSQRSVNVNSF
jgi:hypothetical protein